MQIVVYWFVKYLIGHHVPTTDSGKFCYIIFLFCFNRNHPNDIYRLSFRIFQITQPVNCHSKNLHSIDSCFLGRQKSLFYRHCLTDRFSISLAVSCCLNLHHSFFFDNPYYLIDRKCHIVTFLSTFLYYRQDFFTYRLYNLLQMNLFYQ